MKMVRARISRRVALAGLGAGALALATPPISGVAAARSASDADPAVIADWNATAVDTIVTDAGKANAETNIWFAFTQAAVYNAVVGITRRYELYQWDARGPRRASPQAAAAAAAHRVLLTYFGNLPAAQARLTGAYAASLARIPDGPAKQQGVRFGERAADHIIELRQNDGRGAPLTFDAPPAPGAWRPTLPAMAPFFDPWLSQMEPLLIRSQRQFRPDGPFPLRSPAYAAEFNEVKTLGSKTSTVRTPAQTETALFISSIPFAPFQAALRDLVTRRGLDISESARLFAAVDMSIADAVGVAWDSKLHYGFWRPITAIRLADDDGNPATAADPTWEPLLVTPPYPDHTSGFCSVAGALTRALTRVLGSSRIDLHITSPATSTSRHYAFADQLRADGVDARVWGGLHFRRADVLALEASTRVADWALDHYFQPRRSSEADDADGRD
jgi:hypothetical protein